ncbi:hypothetical protein [Pseudoalteromonas spongiae]|uniref:hypothetical protein n=1 Tax=Pseudoalteromonas spongiae TaxID=298657 RepID=UPI0012FE0C3B|nr:hypothetical protein [Pseudoalteromonas spongiae]
MQVSVINKSYDSRELIKELRDKYHDFNFHAANDPTFVDDEIVEQTRCDLTVFEDEFESKSKKFQEELNDYKQLQKQANNDPGLYSEIRSRGRYIDELSQWLMSAPTYYDERVEEFNKYLELTGRELYQRKKLAAPSVF